MAIEQLQQFELPVTDKPEKTKIIAFAMTGSFKNGRPVFEVHRVVWSDRETSQEAAENPILVSTDQQIEEMIKDRPTESESGGSGGNGTAGGRIKGRVRNPLDIMIKEECKVFIRLIGDFWRFAEDDQFTTKRNCGDRYYQLQAYAREDVDGDNDGVDDIKVISFNAEAPPKPPVRMRHGFSLNVEFVDGRGVIPITIDPTIKNEG